MKNSPIIILVIISFSVQSFSQWTKVEQIASPDIYSVLFDGEDIFVGGDSLFISRNLGLTWQSIVPGFNPIEITALYKTNNTIFLGTYGNGVFISSNNGDSWQSFNNGLSEYAKYSKKFVSSGDTVFYGTDGGGVYYFKIGSNSWQAYNENLYSNIAWTVNDIAVTNINLVLSAGASGFYYLRPKGASQWTEARIQTPKGTYTTPNTFLSIGNIIFSGSRSGIYRSVDNGINWDSVGITALPLNVVSFTKNGNRIFAGYSTSSDFFIWYSDDMGDNWSIFDHQFYYLRNIYVYDNKIWAATNDGLYFKQIEATTVEPILNIQDFMISQNYPNPFNPVTKIKWHTNESGHHSLIVYDVLGQRVATLVNNFVAAGKYEIEFDASELASGIYFYTLQNEKFVDTKKMILLK